MRIVLYKDTAEKAISLRLGGKLEKGLALFERTLRELAVHLHKNV